MSMPEVVRVQDVSKVFKLHRDTSVKDRVLHSSRARVEEFRALDNVSVFASTRPWASWATTAPASPPS